MPIYLNECQAGVARDLIGFPNLLVCMGVVVQTRAHLYGFHFDDANVTLPEAGAFRDFITTHGGNVANAVALYGCCNWGVRYGQGGNQKRAWKQEMRQIAGTLGYQGVVRGFDTTIVTSCESGRYVEFHPEYGQQRCRIYWKVQNKPDFTVTHTSPETVKRQTKGSLVEYTLDMNNQAQARTSGVSFTSDFAPQVSKVQQLLVGAGLTLAELDYANQLWDFQV
jgi:hypothetical protein